MTRQEALLKDVREMTAQWRLEVPGGRKAWPKSIRDRVLELSRLGMGSTAIAKATGLTYFTIHAWKKRKPDFKALAIKSPATVTVPVGAKPAATVTVTTAKGLKFEGITFEQALIVAKELR
jgi:hypothetical protein